MAVKKSKTKKAAPKEPLKVFSSNSFPLLKGIFNHPIGAAWDELYGWNFVSANSPGEGAYYYRRLWALVIETQEFTRHVQVGNGLQDFFLERLLEDTNPFHRKAELVPLHQITSSLVKEYESELKGFLQFVLRPDWESEIKELEKKFGFPTPSLKDTQGLAVSVNTPWLEERRKIKEKILNAFSSNLVKDLADFFYQNGCGLFGRNRAFRWEVPKNGKGHLTGIEAVDPIRLENLVGYDEQRKPLIENIESFVAEKGANNVLIYGERGTGKSSTVKALLNTYQEKGLRLVEVPASRLDEFHDILRDLRGRREKFILFVDDLSFEENETQYKGLKALLEGSIEATPPNVILIATSNRRHLVKEFFAEREEGVHKDGEVHGQDSVEEKLSLSDRFGLVVSFYTPDQETYLKIVESWARFEGIKLPKVELHSRALKWEKANHVRSGRTARQFIYDLKGKI